jgi:hypothetical protein
LMLIFFEAFNLAITLPEWDNQQCSSPHRGATARVGATLNKVPNLIR